MKSVPLTTLHIGISTCPNDTFAFDALIRREVTALGIDFEFEYLDIEQLNRRLLAGEFDLAKTSFAAATRMSAQTMVLPVGAALGFGVGPLLLAARPNDVPQPNHQPSPGRPHAREQRCLCPGQLTTATALMEMFYPNTCHVDHVVFSDIMPALTEGLTDFGVCIHEGRFVWQEAGLHLVEDLGERWESEMELPLPLGGLVARRGLSADTMDQAIKAIRKSILHGRANPQETLPTMRHHAQEFDDEVLMQHVDLYVSDWTVDLGETGRRCLDEFARRCGRGPLEVFTESN